jgi:hypothetical protein
MPKKLQVAARISDEQEKWLGDYFRTKSAGAEFILPWAMDSFFRAIGSAKKIFSAAELKTLVEAHKDTKLLPEHARQSYLLLRVNDACDVGNLHVKHGTGKSGMEAKVKQLDDTQATALMVWASAFWVSRACSADSLEEYIANY